MVKGENTRGLQQPILLMLPTSWLFTGSSAHSSRLTQVTSHLSFLQQKFGTLSVHAGFASGITGLVAGPIIGATRGGVKGCLQGAVVGGFRAGLKQESLSDLAWAICPALLSALVLHKSSIRSLGKGLERLYASPCASSIPYVAGAVSHLYQCHIYITHTRARMRARARTHTHTHTHTHSSSVVVCASQASWVLLSCLCLA